MTIICTNLVDLESPMLYNKIQPQSFLGSEKIFKTFTILFDLGLMSLSVISQQCLDEAGSTMLTFRVLPH